MHISHTQTFIDDFINTRPADTHKHGQNQQLCLLPKNSPSTFCLHTPHVLVVFVLDCWPGLAELYTRIKYIYISSLILCFCVHTHKYTIRDVRTKCRHNTYLHEPIFGRWWWWYWCLRVVRWWYHSDDQRRTTIDASNICIAQTPFYPLRKHEYVFMNTYTHTHLSMTYPDKRDKLVVRLVASLKWNARIGE